MGIKELIWEGSSLNDLKKFPKIACRKAGYELHHTQNGENPSNWKPMTSIGSGIKEIRIHVGDQYRIIYVASFPEAIHVLHAFQKKEEKTSKKDIELAKRRYTLLINRRK